MQNKYALVLVPLKSDLTDMTGNQYEKQGFVKSHNFQIDSSLETGLHGVLWGKTDSVVYFKENNFWAIVKIEDESKLIHLYKDNNFVKFESGLVVHCSEDKKKAADYLAEYIHTNKVDLKPWQISGYEDKVIDSSRPAKAEGSSGKAITLLPNMHAMVTGENCKAITYGEEAHAIGVGPKTSACTIADNSHAIVMNSNGIAKTVGSSSIAVAIERQSRAISSGKGSMSVCLNVGGKACAGEEGTIILAYLDKEGKMKIAVGYIGNNIMANRIYRCDENGEFILVV